jgi:hypothetical protein
VSIYPKSTPHPNTHTSTRAHAHTHIGKAYPTPTAQGYSQKTGIQCLAELSGAPGPRCVPATAELRFPLPRGHTHDPCPKVRGLDQEAGWRLKGGGLSNPELLKRAKGEVKIGNKNKIALASPGCLCRKRGISLPNRAGSAPVPPRCGMSPTPSNHQEAKLAPGARKEAS